MRLKGEEGKMMKKRIFSLAALFAVLMMNAAEPLLHWDFRNAEPYKESSVHFAGTGSRKGILSTASKNQPLDAGALVCGPDIGPQAWGFRLSDLFSAEIEVSFKLNNAPSRQMMLFTYEEWSWGRAWLGICITKDSKIGTEFHLAGKEGKTIKTFRMETAPVVFSPGITHTVRVSLVSGGMGRIYLDGKLLKEESGALCFSDFKNMPVPPQPLVTAGYSFRHCRISDTLDGVITDLSVSSGTNEKPPHRKEAMPADSRSRADVNLLARRTSGAPRIDGKVDDVVWNEAEWSEPFLVLGSMSKTVNQLWLAADEKFVKTASRAAMLFDSENLYMAVCSPVPEGMKTQTRGPWNGDHVEIFLRPVGSTEFYYQLGINADGVWTGLKNWIASGVMEPWTPEGLQIAVKNGEAGFDVEVLLPLASLCGEAPTDGTVWTGNFARGGNTCGGLSTWAPVGTIFQSPDRFGKFVFGSRKSYFESQLKTLEAEMSKLQDELPPSISESRKHLAESLEENGEASVCWTPLHNQFRSLENQLVQAINKGKTHLVWQADPWSNFGPDLKIPFETRELETLNLETAKGARAIASFFVTNLTDRALMTNLMFLTDPKKKNDPKTQAFAAKVRFRELAYIEMNGGKMMPDPIFELPVGAMLRVAPNTTSIVWLDVDTSGLEPGNYTGTIRLFPSFSGFEQKELRLNLRVSPVDVSKVFVRNWTWGVRHANKFHAIREYGFNVLNPIPPDFTPTYNAEGKAEYPRLEAMLRAMEANGIPRKEMMWKFYPEFAQWADTTTDEGKRVKFLEPEWKKFWSRRYLLLRDWLREQGFGYDQYLFNPTDEPGNDPAEPGTRAWYAFEGGKFLKEVDPNFRLLENPHLVMDGRQKQYFEMFDILVPFYPSMDRKVIEEYRDSGREIWSYTVYQKGISPAKYRHRFWENLDAGFPGPACFYDLFAMSGDGFNSYDSNGTNTVDYGAAYWNERVRQAAPSRRLEAWYLGLVDFKTAKFIRKKIADRKKAGLDTSADEKELSDIIQEGFRSDGSMELAGKRLLALAERLMKE